LAPVQDPLRAVVREARRRLHVLRVGADLGLGQRIRGERVAAREHRQILGFLLVRTEQHDRLRAEPAVNADQHGQRRIEARNLAEHPRVPRRRQPDPAVLAWNGDAEQPVFGERADRRLGDRLLLVEARRVDQAALLHVAQRTDEPADGRRLIGIARRERRRIWKEQGVVQGAGEETADDGGHADKTTASAYTGPLQGFRKLTWPPARRSISIEHAALAAARRNGRPPHRRPRRLRRAGLSGLGRRAIAAPDRRKRAPRLRQDRRLAAQPAGEERLAVTGRYIAQRAGVARRSECARVDRRQSSAGRGYRARRDELVQLPLGRALLLPLRLARGNLPYHRVRPAGRRPG